MKLVRKVRLVFREGKSDKVYEVDLVELPGAADARYLVNFRYGRRGSALREGTKTAAAVALAEAEGIYQSVVVSKTNSGYWDDTGPAPDRATAPRPAAPDTGAQQAVRVAALLAALQTERNSAQRSRILWNLGQGDPGANTAAVMRQAGQGEWLEDYSVAWTLGRWRDPASQPTLEKLRRHANAHVREIAFEAQLLTMTPAAAANEVQPLKAELPPGLAAAVEARDPATIARALDALMAEKSAALNRALMACYRLALVEPSVQRALLAFCATCALVPGVFRGVRHLFKTAELRIDDEMFACLAHRFETTRAFFRSDYDHLYVPGQGSITPSKELPKENSRLAYSNSTRTYLRKRAWRTLRWLGRADSPHYVALATAALLRVTDADAVAPRKRGPRQFDEFAPYVLFNHILRGAHPGYRLSGTSTAWYHTRQPATGVRGEPFAHLWDRAPAAALDLLKQSRCGVVHDAAILMLAGQREFTAALSAADIAQLIASPYAQTARFALPLAESLFTRGAGDEALLLALLRSALPEAREAGVRFLKLQSAWATNPSLLIELLLTFGAPVPEIVDAALAGTTLSDADQQQVLAGVITQLLARNLDLQVPQAENLARILVRRLPAAVAATPVTLLDRLLAEPAAGRQVLGARLLVASTLKFSEIPTRLLQHIHGSAHEDVRAIAIALLGKQTHAELLQQMDSLAELLYRGSTAERREMLALFETLAAPGGEAEERVLRGLSPLLFRGDQAPGQGDEVGDFILAHRDGAARTFGKDVIWRLLQAQAAAAQRVGAALLTALAPADFSVKQWARLGQHADLVARQYALQAFESNEARVKEHTRDALRLLDSPWDDAREFGFKYFRERYTEGDWSPEYIVGVCDSTRPDVQDFGRELLQRFFQQAQGPHYLAALSEHPSVNVQLFVTGFLEHHAAGQRDRILELREFFVSVLSRINQGRTAKDRVLAFLLREALADDAVATMVAAIFTRLSLTIVRRDRADLIKAMIAMRAAFPQLSVPINAVPVRGSAPRSEVAGGI